MSENVPLSEYVPMSDKCPYVRKYVPLSYKKNYVRVKINSGMPQGKFQYHKCRYIYVIAFLRPKYFLQS